MKYIILLSIFFEAFWISGFILGGEYPEGVIVPLAISTIMLILFFRLVGEYKKNYALALSLIGLLLLMAVGEWSFIHFKGANYYYENWKGMDLSEYRRMLLFSAIVALYQLIKLVFIIGSHLISNKEKRSYLRS